ncbi:MAG TPA: GYD domain-containing protein [Gaiellaceae bacterium]|nr:GYD domain-containing protein [Gaiellaceae bacterium]
MPLYLIEFGYTPEAWAGLVKSPENREEIVRAILEDAGGKLHSLWYTFGESDGFALMEAPDNTIVAGLSIAISSSGAFRKFETHVLMTQGEVLEALEKAGEVAYTAPGAAVHA